MRGSGADGSASAAAPARAAARASQLLLEGELKSGGERVTLELELSWSAAGA